MELLPLEVAQSPPVGLDVSGHHGGGDSVCFSGVSRIVR